MLSSYLKSASALEESRSSKMLVKTNEKTSINSSI